jgi:hypothetical protein
MKKNTYIQIPDPNNKIDKAFDLLFDEVFKKRTYKKINKNYKVSNSKL